MDLWLAVKQGSGSLLLFSGDGTVGAPSCLQESVHAGPLPRQVEPEGMDELGGETRFELFCRTLLKQR